MLLSVCQILRLVIRLPNNAGEKDAIDLPWHNHLAIPSLPLLAGQPMSQGAGAAASWAGKYLCTGRLLHLGFCTGQIAACKLPLTARCLEQFGCPPYGVRRCSGREHLSVLLVTSDPWEFMTRCWGILSSGDYVNWNLRRGAPSFKVNHPLASCVWIY